MQESPDFDINWDNVDISNPRIPKLAQDLEDDYVAMMDIQNRIRNGESNLPYDEGEEILIILEQEMEVNRVFKDLLDRAIAMKELNINGQSTD